MTVGKLFLKKTFFSILILSLILSSFIVATESADIKIQLRLKNYDATDKMLDNLKLLVNKREVEISWIEKKERYIDKEELLGRNFVLSFMNFNKFNDALKKAISYFVTEVLDKSDSLIIHTNANVYQMKISGNKERIILNITKLLKKDMALLSKKSFGVLKSIKNKISNLERHFSMYSSLLEASESGVIYFQFFSEIISDIQFYRDEFVIPKKRGFKEINDFLGFREGDRYWIFIQNGDAYPFMKRVRKIVRSVRTNLMSIPSFGDKSWKKMVDNKIREMLDTLYVETSYPKKLMKTNFINTNTSFFNLMYNIKSLGSAKSVNHQLANILKDISEDTGGIQIETFNLENGIKIIRNHHDIFWDIFFKMDKAKKKNRLKLVVGGGDFKPVYRTRFKGEELGKLLKYLSEPKISANNLKCEKRIISFSIESFSLNKKGKFGLLKVIIHFYDKTGKEIYRKSNTLRASKKRINISTEIPAELFIVHSIRVSVLDLVSNRLNCREIIIDKSFIQSNH